jgi:hypothetical protein
MPLQIGFKVTFKKGPKVVAEIKSTDTAKFTELTIGEVAEKVIQTEQFLEKLTGYRVHIETVTE